MRTNNGTMLSLDILQWNFHRSVRAADSLKCCDKVEQIWLVQEPHTYNKKVTVKLKGFRTYAKQARNRNRTCILAKQDINLLLNEELSSDDFTVCVLESKDLNLILASGYLDIEKPVIQEELTKIVEYSREKGFNLVIGLDSNAWSTSWGMESANERGIGLEEFMAVNNLYVANEGRIATFENAIRSSIIDITITNKPNLIRKWSVQEELIYSDHRKITFEINAEIIKEEKLTRNLSNTNWNLFRKHLNNKRYVTIQKWNKNNLNTAAEEWNQIVKEALDQVAPRKKITAATSKPEWFDNNLRVLRRKMHNCYRQFKLSELTTDKETFKEARRKYCCAVKKAKQKSWETFCSKIDNVSDMAKLNKIVNRNTCINVGLIRGSNELTNDTKETLDALLESHFEKSVKMRQDPECQLEINYNDIHISWINLNSIKQAIKEFSPFKNSVDEVKPIVLQNLSRKALVRLKAIFEASISLGYTPRIWRTQQVVFIPKPGKKDYSDPRAFRPITLASFVFKTLEKLCLWEIEKKVEIRPINENQHGFRRGRSTCSALSETLFKIESGVLNKGFSMAVFLDLKGAFDNVDPDLAIKKLNERGIDPKIVKWYESFIKNRKIFTVLNNVEEYRIVSTGLGQGLHTSALLWNLCFDDILKDLDKDGVNCVGFADDVALIGTGIDIDTIRSNLQRKINDLVVWGKKNGLEFNAQKTEVMIFTNKKKWTCKRVKVDGNEIEFSDCAKYLGIKIDRKINWNEHIKAKIQNARKQLFMLRRVIGQTWGPQPKMLKWAYTTIVRPALSYGCHIWSNKLTEYQIRDLKRVNRLACLMIGQVQKSAPTSGLEMIFNLEPLHIFLERTAIANYIRIKDQIRNFWGGESQIRKKSHLKLLEQKSKNWGIVQDNGSLEMDECDELRIWTKRYTIKDFQKGPWKEEEEDIYIYTDGSKTGNGVGFGFFSKGLKNNFKKAVKLKDYNSVFQAEVLAIKEAVIWAGNKFRNKKIVLRCDSQSVLLALKAATCSKRSVLQAIVQLNKLGLNNNVKLEWVCSHEAITPEGNNIADELAKEATEMDANAYEFPPPKTHWKQKIKSKSMEIWEKVWMSAKDKNNKELYRQTRLFIQKPNNKAKKMGKYSRKTLGDIANFVTGHCNVMYHNNNKDPEKFPDVTCRLCEAPGSIETVWHLIARCAVMIPLRISIWKRYEIKDDELFEWEFKDILRFTKSEKIQSILNGMGWYE